MNVNEQLSASLLQAFKSSVIVCATTSLVACSNGDPSSATTDIPNLCFSSNVTEVLIEADPQRIGSDVAYPEERPSRIVSPDPFFIDATEVTNAQFAQFVEKTGYVTVAEREPDLSLLPPSVPEEMKQPGSAIFKPPTATSPSWWHFQIGANWRQPEGPGSSIEGREHHPVVQVGYADAKAYADWAGRRLPTEAEWEVAARGGLKEAMYEWGDTPPEETHDRANTWQGFFPFADEALDGFNGTAPVGCFPANGYGLHDMTGNVWEWTDTPYQNAKSQTGEDILTLKGGSWLCAENYCRRYRPAARQGQEAGLPTNHIGFRTARDAT